VVSVFPDPVLELHTTRSWDFLESDLGMKLSKTLIQHSSSDTIIAVIDTGNCFFNSPNILLSVLALPFSNVNILIQILFYFW